MTRKEDLYARLISTLRSDLTSMEDTQRMTQAGAVHAEAKQESDKDTRAIESQYLARGLAQRVEELREAVGALQAVAARSFSPGQPVALTALVTVEDSEGHQKQYLLAPAAGGRKLGDVAVVTLESPIGRALVGKYVGDEVTIRTPQGPKTCEITGVA